MFSLPDFDYAENALQGENPAETHGRLCGWLCADATVDPQGWIAAISSELSVDESRVQEAEELLRELFTATVSQLDDEDWRFSLLLPDDEESLSKRAWSLACWCRGFLTGLGLGGVGHHRALPATVQEFLRDLLAISQLDSDISAENEDEESFMELVEYLRIGVLLVAQELGSRSAHA